MPPPASLPMAASTTLQMLVRIRGLATACPTVTSMLGGGESQRRALAYRKPQWLLLHVERWAMGTLYIEFHTHRDPGYALWRGRSGQGGGDWSQNHLRTSLSQMASLVAQALHNASLAAPIIPGTHVPLKLPPATCVIPPPCVCPSVT